MRNFIPNLTIQCKLTPLNFYFKNSCGFSSHKLVCVWGRWERVNLFPKPNCLCHCKPVFARNNAIFLLLTVR